VGIAGARQEGRRLDAYTGEVEVLEGAARHWSWLEHATTPRLALWPASPHHGCPEQPVSLSIAFVVRRVTLLCAAAAAASGRQISPNLIWRLHILDRGLFREDENVQGALNKLTTHQAGGFLQTAWYRNARDPEYSIKIQRHRLESAGLH
jgi:hypothetical protein